MAENNILAGRLTIDTSDFIKKISEATSAASQQISKMQEAADRQSQSELRNIDAQKKARLDYISFWEKALAKQEAAEKRSQDKTTAQEIKKVSDAYKNLTTAVSEYGKAKKRNDSELKDYWKKQADDSGVILESTQKNINALGLDANARQKIMDIIQKSKIAMDSFDDVQRRSVITVDGLANEWNKVAKAIKVVSGISLYKIFGEALSYAKEFDKAVIDIGVITKSTAEDARALGSEYRKMANDLNVTSTSIAKAAATIYRQGVTDAKQVEKIVEGATKFGAVTGQTTDAAIKNMTAAMQNFLEEGQDVGDLVEHIGDVWSYMGDTVATTGEDISAAMSKTAASIKSVGVEFEKASSWAAIMLAKTQQSGEVIGTQLNSLVARYAKVTSKGYAAVTADDEGEALNFNDVSKALQKAGIEMYDAAMRTFLPMGDMMDQLHEKWGSLDEATKKYIATTLGGTRGMNYLLTLLDNYNAALNLQSGIIDGIVDDKYATWMQGIEAAQNNLTNSMENMYAYMSADVLAGFYNGLAGVVDMVVRSSDAIGGWNIKAIAMVATLGAIAAGIAKIITIAKTTNGALGFLSALSGGSIGMIAAGVALLGTAIGGIVSAINSAKEPAIDLAEVAKKIQESEASIAKWEQVGKGLNELANGAGTAAEKMEQFNEIRKQIVTDSPYLQAVYGDEGEKIKTLAEAYEIYLQKIREEREILEANKTLAYDENRKKFLGDTKSILGSGFADPGPFGWGYYGGRPTYTQDAPGMYLTLADEYIEAGAATLKDAREMKADLERFAQEIDVGGLELEKAYNDVMNKVAATITTKTRELQKVYSDMIANMPGYSDMGMDGFLMSVFEAIAPQGDAAMAQIEKYAGRMKDLYARAMKGITEPLFNELSKEAIIGSMRGYNMDFLWEPLKAYTDALGNSLSVGGITSDIRQQYMEFVESGLAPEILSAINDAFDALENYAGFANGDERSGAIVDMVKRLLSMSEGELSEFAKDYTIALPLKIEPKVNDDEMARSAQALAQNAFDKIDEILAKYSEQGITFEKVAEHFKSGGTSGALSAVSSGDLKLLENYYRQYEKLIELEKQAHSLLPEGTTTSDAQKAYDQLMEMYALQEKLQKAAEESMSAGGFEKGLSEYGISSMQSAAGALEDLKAQIEQLEEPYAAFFDMIGVTFEKPTEDAKTFAEQLDEVINRTSTLQEAIGFFSGDDASGFTPFNTDKLLELAEAYPTLTDAIREYMEAITAEVPEEGTLAAASENLLEQLSAINEQSDFFDGIERIQSAMEALSTLDGPYTVEELEGIVNSFSELAGLTPDEMVERLNEMVDEGIEKWGEFADAMGVTIGEIENYGDKVSALVHPMTDAQKAVEKLTNNQQLSLSEIENLLKLYPELSREIEAYGRDTSNVADLISGLNMYDAIDAQNAWRDAVDAALGKLEQAEAGTRDYALAMDDLAAAFDFEGMGTLSNLDFVIQNLDNIRAAANGSEEAFRALQEAAWINITGTGSADFSSIENGIRLVGEDANKLGDLLVRLGWFTTETQQLQSGQEVITGMVGNLLNGFTLNKSYVPVTGTYNILKPTSGNPFAKANFSRSSGKSSGSSSKTPARSVGGSRTPSTKKSSGGSGGSGKKGSGGSGNRGSSGGSSGSSTIKVSDATQQLIEDMEKVQTNFENRLKMIDLKKKYHEIRGEIQGVTKYTELERKEIEAQNAALKQNIAQLNAQIAKQQAVIKANSASSTKYKQAATDLNELNKSHKEYTEQLQQNINRLEEIRKEVQKFQEDARKATIAVQDLIRDTLEGRRAYERKMLDGTVELEDEILEIIRARYEKEQELALETADKKRDALQAEIDKIDELSNARKKLYDKQKKEASIAELQAKIARISADPTRRKEQLELEKQLADKQEELAWETYEEVLQAQKDSLQAQMDNLDEHTDQINKYYEDLFKNPKKLIEEMKQIIIMSDKEIINWLKTNSEDWGTYTEARQKQTIENWQEMINTMRGVTETYQKEIAEIMSWTDEEILEWLKNNNVEFKNSTKEQQDSFLYGWKQTLDDWRNAYKDTVAEISNMVYENISVSGGDGSGGSGSGSYGGGSYSGGGSYGGGSYYSGSNISGGGSSGNTSSGGSSSVFTAMDSAGKTQAQNQSTTKKTTTTKTTTQKVNTTSTSLFTATSAQNKKTATTTTTKPKTYSASSQFKYKTPRGGEAAAIAKKGTSTKSQEEAKKAANAAALAEVITTATKDWDSAKSKNTVTLAQYTAAIAGIKSANASYVWQAYKEGGLAKKTGLAWLDGTPSRPERVLSAEQTAMFEDLLRTLHAIKTVNISGISRTDSTDVGTGAGTVTIEQLTIQVPSLDDDADYELIAGRVGEAIMEELQKKMVVGGIRMR